MTASNCWFVGTKKPPCWRRTWIPRLGGTIARGRGVADTWPSCACTAWQSPLRQSRKTRRISFVKSKLQQGNSLAAALLDLAGVPSLVSSLKSCRHQSSTTFQHKRSTNVQGCFRNQLQRSAAMRARRSGDAERYMAGYEKAEQ